MAPKKNRNIKTSGDSESLPQSQTVVTKSPARTPIQSPRKKAGGLTVAQKQALIDNLQLEVTERARKLRAQYALQAQSLRTRIELRVNRIPNALRKATMGELLEKHSQPQETKSAGKPSSKETAPRNQIQIQEDPENGAQTATSTRNPRGTKRTSDEISVSEDKENAASDIALPNPKKRAKAATTTKTNIDSSTVLSPKSANSRILPRRQQQGEKASVPFVKPQSQPRQQTSTIASGPASPLRPGLSPSKLGANTTAATSLLSSMLAPSSVNAAGGQPSTSTVRTTAGAGAGRAKPGRPAKGTSAAPTASAPHLTRNPSNTSTVTTATQSKAAGAGARGKRAPAGAVTAGATTDMRKASNTSTLSTTSMVTTIVNKNAGGSGKATAGAAAAAKSARTGRGAAATAAGKKGAASAVAGTVTGAGAGAGATAGVKSGRRVLRKR